MYLLLLDARESMFMIQIGTLQYHAGMDLSITIV